MSGLPEEGDRGKWLMGLLILRDLGAPKSPSFSLMGHEVLHSPCIVGRGVDEQSLKRGLSEWPW